MAVTKRKKLRILVFGDDGRIARNDEFTTASLVKARQRAIAIMKVKNCPLALIDCLQDNKYIVYEIIYGTPMGKLFWCNLKIDNCGYLIRSDGVPGIGVAEENMWTRMGKDISWTQRIYSVVSRMRDEQWSISDTL